jgi:hypothetical protein
MMRNNFQCARHNERRLCEKNQNCRWNEYGLIRKRHAGISDLFDRRYAPLGRCELSEGAAKKLPWLHRMVHHIAKIVSPERMVDRSSGSALTRTRPGGQTQHKWRLRSPSEMEGIRDMRERDSLLAKDFADLAQRKGWPSYRAARMVRGVPKDVDVFVRYPASKAPRQ